ncbi:hypothetical protein [Sneathiella glossodoripedis]|uniref:hypothetical protein n=1 Tax=Sneathiella glossodoripedis TaxID=418853 RepID=UPI00046FF29A|nr:hypothetical protein [Sneathiella glossodoripedis]
MGEDQNAISNKIQELFQRYPDHARIALLHVRDIIYDLSTQSDAIGKIEENIKWGEASFATINPKSGTPIRLAYREPSDKCAILVHCGTTLVDDFKQTCPPGIEFEKNRALLFNPKNPPEDTVLKSFLFSALTYYK